MAITYGSSAGTIITSYAMDEALGDQGQQTGNNTVVVSDDISTAGNGEIGTLYPTYVGRKVIIDLGGTEQDRMVISQAAGTGNTIILTVNEDWDANPVATTDTIHVMYNIDDIETGGESGGISLNSRTGLYELSNKLTVGNFTDPAGLLAHDGIGLEIDDDGVTIAFQIAVHGRFDSGYLHAGSTVSGAILLNYCNSDGEPFWAFNEGCTVRLYDTILWSQVSITWGIVGPNDVDIIFKNTKFLGNTYGNGGSNPITFRGAQIYDCIIQGRGGAGSDEYISISGSGANPTTVDGLILIGTNGLTTREAATSVVEIRNVTFIGNSPSITIIINTIWNVIDPVWSPIVTDQSFFDFLSGTGTGVNWLTSVLAIIQEADGTLLADAVLSVFEGTLLGDLVIEDVSGADGLAGGEFLYKNIVAADATAVPVVTTYGDHALWIEKWLYRPFVAALSSIDPFEATVTLIPDTNIEETTQATALSVGAAVTWNEDDAPSSIISYTGGSGTLSVGNTVTGGDSGAYGVVTAIVSGDSVSGTIHLKDRNATEVAANIAALASEDVGSTNSSEGGYAFGLFPIAGDDLAATPLYEGTEQLSNGAGWTADLTEDSQQDFTIWIDATSITMQQLYDYLAALTSQTTLSATGELLREWGRDSKGRAIDLGGSGFFSEMAYNKGVFVTNFGSGTIYLFTADDGGTWTPPASYEHILTGLELNTEITYVDAGTADELFHVENASVSDGDGKYKTTYTHLGIDDVDILIHHVDYKPDISNIYGLTLPSADASVKIKMFDDENYYNPT